MERHDTDWTSLISGLLFAGLGMLFLADGWDAFDLRVRWVWPALLIGLGIALLASGSRNGNGEGDHDGDRDSNGNASDAADAAADEADARSQG